MKRKTNKPEEAIEEQKGPKLRNIHDKTETKPEEKPKGADIRIKICAAAVLVLILFVGIKGFITKTSLESQTAEQKKTLEDIKAEALKYDIKEDEDGTIIIPDNASGGAVTGFENIDEGKAKVLDEFAKLLLNWKGQTEYNNVRQTLINEKGFSSDCKLLSSFMPEVKEKLTANMSMSEYSIFVLSEDAESSAYFLLCTVRNTIDGKSASGMVGLQIKINNENKITNVTAQTLQ